MANLFGETGIKILSCNNGGFQNSGSSPSVMEVEDSPDELSTPIGLTLSKSPSFINLLESMLSEEKSLVASSSSKSTSHKLKASNFPIMSISIGDWKRATINGGDLTAKLYYAKRKLVWEVLQRPLKWKMEIQWNNIIAIRALIRPNEHGYLGIELNQPPTFGEEINPQPRKHTIWQTASDFTHGQATTWRRHFVMFPPGILDKHYEQLLQCDERLLDLSRKPFPLHEDACFRPNPSFGISQNPLNLNGYGSSGRVMPVYRLPYPPPWPAPPRGSHLRLPPNPPISGMHFSNPNNIERNPQFMHQRNQFMHQRNHQQTVWNHHQGINTLIHDQSLPSSSVQIQGNNQVFNPYPNYLSNQGSFQNGISNEGSFQNGLSNEGSFQNGLSNQGSFQNGLSNQGSYQNCLSNEGLQKIDNYLIDDTYIDEDTARIPLQVDSISPFMAANVNTNPNNNDPYDNQSQMHDNQMMQINQGINPSSVAVESTVDNSDGCDLLDIPDDLDMADNWFDPGN